MYDYNRIEIELSSDCNAACPLCVRTQVGMSHYGNNNISIDQFKRIFPDKAAIEGKQFLLVGVSGEPVVAPDFMPIVKYISKHNPAYIIINTNAGINSVQFWKELASVPHVEVEFSIDGHRETNHIYRVNVKWENIERNITAFSNAGGTGRWIFIPFKHNECEFNIAVNHAAELGFEFEKRSSGRNAIEIKKPITTKDRKTDNVHTISLPEVYTNTNNVSNINSAIQDYKTKRQTEKLRILKNTINCKHLSNKSLYISADLKLWHCCYMHDYYIHANYKNVPTVFPTNFNDLTQYSITDILQSDPYTKLQEYWDPDSNKFILKCLKSCGDNAAYKNTYEKIDKSSK